jgi:phosphatidylglycerophosphate synthase
MSPEAPAQSLGYHDFLSRNGGGYLFTRVISQRIGAACALIAHRLRITPTTLTLINLVLSIATAAMVIAVVPQAKAGDLPWWPIAILAAIGWQLAYGLDCADGQLARAAGIGSPAGARVDVLCDIVSQAGFAASVAAVTAAYSPHTPTWFIAGFASLWLVNLVTSTLQKGDSSGSITTSRNPVIETVKLARDTGAVVVLMPVILIVEPQWMVWFMVAFGAFNALFLLASIVVTARDAWRASSS